MSVLTSSLLERLEWIEHGFGTRDSQLDQTEMASIKQVHSNVSLVAEVPGCAGEGDALVS